VSRSVASRRIAAIALLAACAALAGCSVGRFIVGAPQPGSVTHTQSLLIQRCSGCHETPDPKSMSAQEWQASLVRMKRRMTLPASEWDSLAAMR
jgi:hypothetical protein